MKNGIIFTLVSLLILGGCTRKESKTIISGKLPDLKNAEIILIPTDEYFPALESTGHYNKTETDSQGVFKFRLGQFRPTYYQIIHNNYHQLKYDIFVDQGDSIYIESAPWNEKPSLSISGKGVEKYNHLIRDYQVFLRDKSFYDKIRSKAFPTETDFKKFIDSLYLERVNTLNMDTSAPEHMKAQLLNKIKAERAEFLLNHLERRNYYMKGEFDYFFPDPAYDAFVDSIEFDASFCRTTEAKILANSYLMYKARNAFKDQDPEKWWKENLSWKWDYLSGLPGFEWSDLLALSTISEFSFGMMQDDFTNNLLGFEKTMDSRFFSDKNRVLFKANISPYLDLAPRSEAPDFELPDSNGVPHRLKDYRGKIVYLDFWGTWCYPCIQEIPDALSLQEKYRDKPVDFIYVALEYDSTDIARWKKFIAGKDQRFGNFLNYEPFPGVHLVAEKQFRNESISPYKLNFAPTHVLIDHRGKIVYARARGSKEISEDIDQLLKEMQQE